MPEDEDPTDWEEWDGNGSFVHHMIAGSVAGVIEHSAMFPIDTVKTYSQCARCGVAQSSVDVGMAMVQKEGFARMWRGVSTMFSGCVPAHAAFFSIFEAVKEKLNQGGHGALADGAAGACATFAHDCIMTPMDVAKQRLQLGYYAGMWDCFRTVAAQEGVGAFYRSFPTTLLMNVPYGMVMATTNEALKRVLNPSGEQNLPAFLAAGAGGGLVASVMTCPLDVAKTRLQTQGFSNGVLPPQISAPCINTGSVVIDPGCDVSNVTTQQQGGRGLKVSLPTPSSRVEVISSISGSSSAEAAAAEGGATAAPELRGLVDALRAIAKEDGWRGFFRGIGPRATVHTASVAISWGAYETMKRMLVAGAEDEQ
jgi:solute carrier family 25 iron transporter 28/37